MIFIRYILISITVLLAVILMAGCTLNVPQTDELSLKNADFIVSANIDYSNFFRFDNTLVLYTFDFPRNEYGYELLVEKNSNCVIDRGERLDIAPDTYILSGHGEAAEFLKQVQIGDIVNIERNELTVTRDLKISNLKILEVENRRVDNIIEHKRAGLYDLNYELIEQIDLLFGDAYDDYERYFDGEIDVSVAKGKMDYAMSLIDMKYALTLESYAVDGRGIWHRPNASAIDETTLEGVREFASYLYDMGINTLYVETFWHGMTTYYSDVIGCQHPRMAQYNYGEYGNDYMLALISECHKLGIEVHGWVELLSASSYYGIKSPAVKDEWIYSDSTGDKSGRYLDPTNPEVQEFLVAIITEMVQKYDFDGISYDYIRYAEIYYLDEYIDNGFTEYSVNAFSKQYGYTGENLIENLKHDTRLRAQWHEFKQNAITATVKNMTDLIRSLDSEVIISSSPYGYIYEAKTVYMQDIDVWLKNGYLDVILPMIYTENVDFLHESAAVFNNYLPNVLQYTGISPLYNGDTIRKNQELIEATKTLNICGVSFFATQNYIVRNDYYAEYIMTILKNSTHSGRAVTPTSDAKLVVGAWKDQFFDRCDRIYYSVMNESEIAVIKNFERALDSADDVNEVLGLLTKLRSDIQDFENSALKSRITESIDYISAILEANLVRSSRL